MFGSSTNGNAPAGGTPSRPAAADVARIEGTLTHILVGDEAAADGINVFVNAKPIPVGEIESLSIEIVAPSDNAPDGTLTALLSRYVDSGTGQRQQATVALFPGTVEVIARGRRLTVTCQQAGSFDGLWLGLGDGTFIRSLLALGQQPLALGAADLDGDGLPDLLIGNAGGLAVFQNAASWPALK